MQNDMKRTWPTHWIEAARSAGLLSGADGTTGQMFFAHGLRDQLERFGNLVQAAERERCAGLFDVPLGINGEAEDWARAAAASIRGPVGRNPAISEQVVT